MKKSILVTLLALLISVVLSGCYEPSPLYGTWMDDQSNKITFINDGTFTAFIYNDYGEKVTYSGDYTVIENVLSFSTSDGSKIVTEWDIRGSMLYLIWATTGSTKTLTLYHTSK